MAMQWEELLTLEQIGDEKKTPDQFRPNYAQDMDRILYSEPFRRLANKTQVDPLYENDHIHHRLIHSLEVASTGRSLGTEVGAWLVEERKELDPTDIPTVSGIVQAACMAHDIGNPPFGHSGEEAIGEWFSEKFNNPTGFFKDVEADDRHEFIDFEGNAQGFRILARTEMYPNDGGMRLTYGTLSAFAKYPSSAAGRHTSKSKKWPASNYIGLKKYGFFRNDFDIFKTVAEKTGLIPKGEPSPFTSWCRHPLAFLMEAADDICYNIMDLEDACTSGYVSHAHAKSLLESCFDKTNKSYPDHGPKAEIARLRALAIRGAIKSCVEAFKDNYVEIMDGTFSQSLTDVCSRKDAFSAIKTTAQEQIFVAPRKTELEVGGRNVIMANLDGTCRLFEKLASSNPDLTSYDKKLARLVGIDTGRMGNAYESMHKMTDFISGMTDRYAVKVAGILQG